MRLESKYDKRGHYSLAKAVRQDLGNADKVWVWSTAGVALLVDPSMDKKSILSAIHILSLHVEHDML